MKHVTEPTSSERYYYLQWKHHCAMFMIALVLLSNGIVWGIVASLYGSAPWVVGLLLAAVLGLFASVIEFRECNRYYLLYLRSLCDWNQINTNTTNQ